ncbi:MAG: hypothetical protein V2J89_17165 [Halieaceae bacterium]|jgi:hypothetical protein|nr:hypothetical protein [Halieaceae bacterium]
MKVLRANTEQHNELNGYRNGNSVLEFTQDASDNWIVGKSVLTDKAFIAIRPQLEALKEIDFNPKQEEI